MSLGQKLYTVLSYLLGVAAVAGWGLGIEELVQVGGWGTAVITGIGLLTGNLRSWIPFVAIGFGIWLIGGLRGALIGNALAVVAFEWLGLLMVFTSRTISHEEAEQRAELERLLRK